MLQILRTLIEMLLRIPIPLWAAIVPLLPLLGSMSCTREIIKFFFSALREKGPEKFKELLVDFLTQVCDATSVEAKVVSIEAKANRIKVMLEDAEQRRYIVREDVRNRLGELRGVAFDFDDVVEEFETRKEETGARSWITWRLYCLRVSEEIDDIEKRCDAITRDRGNFALRENEAPMRRTPTPLPPPQTGSLLGAVQVHGRNAEISEVVQWLFNRPSLRARHAPVISIEGPAGIGKTTIAQYIFDDPRIKNKFQKRIWVDLSPGLDATKTIKKIITSLRNEEECRSLSLNSLQHRLKALLENSTFLLVLNNVWNEDEHLWDVLHVHLVEGRSEPSGSRVLMTTRSHKASQYMHASHIKILGNLDDVSMWCVLRDHAFAQRDQEQINDFVSVGTQIAGKCDGSPLVAKHLGIMLSGNNTTVENWTNVLDQMPDPGEVVDKILPALRVSYDQLPLHLKRCFAYCSIFPKGYEFDKEELVKFWMAQGLINHDRPRPNVRIEDTGRRHFDDLLRRSFFYSSHDGQEHKQKYQMPSQIHELAKDVSRFECMSVNDASLDQQRRSHTTSARYALLSYRTKKLEYLKLICKNKRLRTLMLHKECTSSVDGHDSPVTKVPSDLLKLERLRVLDMSYSQLEELPDSIGDLILLRYLGLRDTWLRTLPRTVKGLRKLET